MGAIRVDVISLAVQSQGLGPFGLWLDCWRATLRIVANDREWLLNGAPVAQAFNFDAAGSSVGTTYFQLGGLCIEGRPVNLNATWDFTPDVAIANPLYGVLIKEYWDPQLPDPITNR